jgi:hypothetical protein
MLFLSAFDRRLFTPEMQQLLQDLPAPYPERKPPKRTLKGVFFRA